MSRKASPADLSTSGRRPVSSRRVGLMEMVAAVIGIRGTHVRISEWSGGVALAFLHGARGDGIRVVENRCSASSVSRRRTS
jgi:hypothetical protein